MISERVLKALNEQVGKEIFSSYLYLSMATYFDSIDLLGFGKWMKVQAREELGHAMKIYEFIYERGGRVELPAIEKPQSNWESPLKAFEAAYNHERFITESINKIYSLAKEENDYATQEFLNWFVKEQVEEEAQTELILKKLQKLQDSPTALYMLDKEAGSRE
ncbi:ferritin [Fervidobacterium sp. 2310opik-2]|uniref:ferritin n=1 Tax=Fervidobacterium sp. 2310opik-2 TaxID=1755815 RepID=UPI0013E002B9|nr:ferritin [Fervidobacterium sp. 2310opik-2]KAF2961025.1 ferritin [Fervidobacterium sp. 2310opik-2]